ncbi:MAG: ABC transporter permease [Bacteroidales bacterium]|nr:ABC transporter permease [Candidatus Latescibacterota bacterium]
MIRNYFKIALRNLARYKMYSLINILGLAIGMAGFILITLWVHHEKSFDRFHEGHENIYRVLSFGDKYFKNGFDGTPGPLGAKAVEGVPEVQAACKFGMFPKLAFRYKDNVFFEKSGVVVSDTFLDIFSYELIKGDRNTVLSDPSSIVITESMAERYFGEEDPIGKVLVSEGFEGMVSGVLKDVPSNSTLRFDYFISFGFYRRVGGSDSNWSAYNYSTYLRLAEGSDTGRVAELMTDIARDNNSAQVSNSGCWYRLEPMIDVHLSSHNIGSSRELVGDKRMVFAFSITALFVLILACINFMNLSTARAGRRAREIGLRKVVGAGRASIVRQFYGESLIYSILAMVLAVLLADLMLPWFNRVSGKELVIAYSSTRLIVLLLGTIAFTTLTAGSYPALYLSAFNPASVLKGEFTQGRRGIRFRKSLVVGQFALSILLLVTASFMSKQMHFMARKDLGFNRENLIYFPVNTEIVERYEHVKNSLLGKPGIISVSAQNTLVPEVPCRMTGYKWDGKDPDHSQDMIFSLVDFDFFRTMGLEMKEGRVFSRDYSTDATSAYILNEEAIRQMKIADPIGKGFAMVDRSGTITGIVKDANLRSLHVQVEPHVFLITEDMSRMNSYGIVLVRIDGNRTSEAIAGIDGVWNEVCSDKPFEYHFMDETYDRLYTAEARAGKVINSFTVFAILISCLGLFGLAAFMAEQKTREIGIRKVMGASVGNIIILLSKEFSKSVMYANIVAWPAAYFIVRRVLQIYAYRIDITPWIFLYSGVAALAIAMITICWQAVRAALSDPVKAVRYE